MMRRLLRPLLVTSCLAFPSCLVGFRHPLGPVGSAFIDQRLVGTWQCTGRDDPKPGVMTIIDFDEKQYFMLFAEEAKEPTQARAYATRVRGVPFLNLQEIGASNKDHGWFILDYVFPDEEHVNMRALDPEPFKDVIESQRGVRKLLERRLKSPDLFVNYLSCVRTPKNAE
jgi:hypothetical protein